MCRMFLGEIIARNGQDEIGRFGCAGDTEYGAGEEGSVGFTVGESFYCACDCGEDLCGEGCK